jgi:hypothetical protein
MCVSVEAPPTTPPAPPRAPVPGDRVEAGALLAALAAEVEGHVPEGVAAVAAGDGSAELRAARDGVLLAVARGARVEGDLDRSVGAVTGPGGLLVEGHVGAGCVVAVTGTVRVEGMVDRAELRAGEELSVAGRAAASVLAAGAAGALRASLRRPLEGVGEDLLRLARQGAQLLEAAAGRPGAPAPAAAGGALVAGRFPDLASRLERADRALREARRGWPGLRDGLAGAVALARACLEDPARPGLVAELATAGRLIAVAAPGGRGGGLPGMRLGSAHGCAIASTGPVRFLGTGAIDCDIDAGGDVVAMRDGAVVRGGTIRAGGRVLARELAGREGAPLVVVLADPGPAAELLRAEVVQAGVEVRVAGEVLRFDRRRAGVRLGVAGGRIVVDGA